MCVCTIGSTRSTLRTNDYITVLGLIGVFLESSFILFNFFFGKKTMNVQTEKL